MSSRNSGPSSGRRVCFHLIGIPSLSVGGSDTFVRGLMRRQTQLGWEPILVANQLAAGDVNSYRTHIPVTETEVPPVSVRVLPAVEGVGRKAYFLRRPAAAPGVKELFAEFKPSVVHFHTLGLTAGVPHLEAAKAIDARTVVTYHTPGVSCPQHALLENGKVPCDGRLEVDRCTRCRFVSQGMPRVIASGVSRLPIERTFEKSEMLLARVLSARSMTRHFINSFREVVELVDVFHIQSQWIREVLRLNGVPDAKIAFVEMGVAQAPVGRQYKPIEQFNEERPLRLVFAGRCNGVKGIETIFGALEYLDQSAPLRISLLGPGWESEYGERLMNLVRGDKRVLPPRLVETEGILYELANHDACLVPSVWLETGPLAVYEAMAAGIPVIGSRLGGIAERVHENIDGILFPPGDAKALAGIIGELLRSPEKLDWLQKNIQPQRNFDEMARELDLLYQPIATPCVA